MAAENHPESCFQRIAAAVSPLPFAAARRVQKEDERPIKDERASVPDAALLEQELQNAIETAIAQLPEAQRLAVVLRRYDDPQL